MKKEWKLSALVWSLAGTVGIALGVFSAERGDREDKVIRGLVERVSFLTHEQFVSVAMGQNSTCVYILSRKNGFDRDGEIVHYSGPGGYQKASNTHAPCDHLR